MAGPCEIRFRIPDPPRWLVGACWVLPKSIAARLFMWWFDRNAVIE